MINVSSKKKLTIKNSKRVSHKKPKTNSQSKKKIHYIRHYGHQDHHRTTKSVPPKRYYGRKYYGPRYSPRFEKKVIKPT